jgi:hypothetical protein
MMTNQKTSRVSLNHRPTRRLVFLFFLTVYVSLTSLFVGPGLVRSQKTPPHPTLSVKIRRIWRFVGSEQKAPMAHRQWSQNQYGFFYYEFRVLFCAGASGAGRPIPEAPGGVLGSVFHPTRILPQSSTTLLKSASFRRTCLHFLL